MKRHEVPARSAAIPKKKPAGKRPLHIEWPHPDGENRFRVLTAPGWRKGIRLEEPYWRLLDIAASNEGRRIGEYVKALLDGAPNENATATLRLHVARLMNEALAAAHSTALVDQVRGILRATPTPCFAVDRARRLLGYNAEFEQHVRRQLARISEKARQIRSEDVRLTLDQSVEQLMELHEAQGGYPLESGYVLSLPDARYAGRVRVAILRSPESEIVVAYVLS